MFSDTKINREKTLSTFGYDASQLSNGSHYMVVVECLTCHRTFCKEYRNRSDKHQCPVVVGQKKKCFKCGHWKDLSLFNSAPKLSGGVAKMCRECYNAHPSVKRCEAARRFRIKHALENNVHYYIVRRYQAIKTRCARNKVPFDLAKEDLIELWERQKGACYYTHIPMLSTMKTSGFQAWDAPSIDRKDPARGYTKGNVVWCIFGVNSFKQSLKEQAFAEAIGRIKWWFLS